MMHSEKYKIGLFCLSLGTVLLACNFFSSQKKIGYYHTSLAKDDSVFIDALKGKSNNAVNSDSAFYYLKEIINYAKQKNNEKQLYNGYAHIAQKYANIGNKDLWNVYFDSAAQIALVTKRKEIKVMFNILEAKTNKRRDSTAHYIERALKDSAYLSPRDIFDIYGFLSFEFMQKKYYSQARKYTELALSQINNIISDTYGRLFNTSVLRYNLYMIELNGRDTISAIHNLKLAAQITDTGLKGKGYPVIYEQMGNWYLQEGIIDSAKLYFDKFNFFLQNEGSAEAADYSRILNAEVFFAEKKYSHAMKELQAITTTNPGSYFAGDKRRNYYDLKYKLHKIAGDMPGALTALEQKIFIDSLNYIEDKKTHLGELEEKLTTARAQNTIMAQGEVVKRQKTYITFLITGLIVAGIVVTLSIINLNRRKTIEKQKSILYEQKAAINQQKIQVQAEKEERTRIAREIHDNIGPAITTLNLAANMMCQAQTQHEYLKIASMILQNSEKLNIQINEIIWSLNSSNDTLISLITFVKKFAAEFLETANIQLVFDTNIEHQETIIAGYKRRLIYSTIKEVINNTVKYAKASLIHISITEKQSRLIITIKDNGIGLVAEDVMGCGYGLQNIIQNIEEAGGTTFFTNDSGLQVELLIPLYFF